MVSVSRLGVQLQLALAAVAIVALLTVGGDSPIAWVAVPVACAAAVCWIVRALVSHRIPKGVDLLLLGVILVGSAVAAVPTNGVGIAPMVAANLLVVGDALRPRWTRWAWPVAAALAASVGFLADRSVDAAVIVSAILVLSVLAGIARRASGQANMRRLRHLGRQYAVELERVRIAAERVITPQRLRERFPTVTAREADVLSLIAHGDSNEEIAAELFISVPTVKSHVNSLFTKLPARDRAQAIALVLGTARRKGEDAVSHLEP
jgi:DNA-binding CsgD family transcriptional regulator